MAVLVLRLGRAVAAALLAEVGAARLASPDLPGNCDKGIVLFCADPAWPD